MRKAWVEILKTFPYHGKGFKKGTKEEVDEKLAKLFIKGKLARATDAPKKESAKPVEVKRTTGTPAPDEPVLTNIPAKPADEEPKTASTASGTLSLESSAPAAVQPHQQGDGESRHRGPTHHAGSRYTQDHSRKPFKSSDK